jgi:hypothetical protein
MRTLLIAAVGCAAMVVATTEAWASGTINYGYRAGEEVDVVSMSGLDTRNAVIRTRHTRANAVDYCREQVGEVSEECISEQLRTPLNDFVWANCVTGEFADFFGNRYRFTFKKNKPGSMARYRIIDLDTGNVEDGSSASGYPVNADTFAKLCPRTAPSDYLE